MASGEKPFVSGVTDVGVELSVELTERLCVTPLPDPRSPDVLALTKSCRQKVSEESPSIVSTAGNTNTSR